jgi:threonylcarbamoyladenosine tRNA methylthiotransferase CDKAL1
MARIRIKTYGCTHNTADSERMAGLLEAAGHELVEEDEELLIVNSCAVKDPSEKKFFHDLKVATVPVVIAGCVTQGNQGDEFLKNFSAVGVKDIEDIVAVVQHTLAGKRKRVITRRKNPALSLPRRKTESLIQIIPVNSGCLSGCTYCKTVHARGRLESHSIKEIVTAIEAAVDNGIKELWITSEDVGAYGRDIDESMASLLEAIAAIRGSFMVRIGMANPQHVIKEVDKILEIIKNNPKRFFRFLHIPVQAGSDAVLEHMERGYGVTVFEEIVEKAREILPDITIMNDYIVGYPSESEEDFAKTLDLASRSECRLLNINKFYPRPGTRAARMKLLPTKVVARRCKELVELYEAQDFNKEYLGQDVEVFWIEKGKNNSLVGHTENYIQVILPEGDEALLGSWHTVKITAENKFYLTAKL